MEVKSITVSVNPGVKHAYHSILVDHYNKYNKTPINKDTAYPWFNITGRDMHMVVSERWADSSIFGTDYIPVRVIGEYENFIVVEVLSHYVERNRMSESFRTTIHKHDIYQGRVNLVD